MAAVVVDGYTMGYFIHILLVAAIIVLVRVIQGRKGRAK